MNFAAPQTHATTLLVAQVSKDRINMAKQILQQSNNLRILNISTMNRPNRIVTRIKLNYMNGTAHGIMFGV